MGLCIFLNGYFMDFGSGLFQANKLQELLVSLHKLPIPEPRVPVHLGVVSLTAIHYNELGLGVVLMQYQRV